MADNAVLSTPRHDDDTPADPEQPGEQSSDGPGEQQGEDLRQKVQQVEFGHGGRVSGAIGARTYPHRW